MCLLKCTIEFMLLLLHFQITHNFFSTSVNITLNILTGDRLGAGGAALGEELPEAVGAVGLVLPGGEPLPGQGLLAVCAGEALSVPRVVAVGHAALGDHLKVKQKVNKNKTLRKQ